MSTPRPPSNNVLSQILIGLFVTIVGGVIGGVILTLLLGQFPLNNNPPATLDERTLIVQTQTREAEQTRAAILQITPPPTTNLQTTSDVVVIATPMYLQTVGATQSIQAAMDTTATPTEHLTATPILIAGTLITHNADWTPVEQDFDGVTMVLVPVGCFEMGNEDFSDAKPVHQQCFDQPFWLDKYEVTNGQFTQFDGEARRESHRADANRPREQIAWVEARDFCALRGARLPTEREWEYAARGPDNLVYPWGNDWNLDKVVWSGNSANQTAEVGSKTGGIAWVGALDLSGNVWEWVSSLYQPYPYQPDDGRENLDETHVRVLRGGSWFYSDDVPFRASLRGKNIPDSGNTDTGFRCARSIP